MRKYLFIAAFSLMGMASYANDLVTSNQGDFTEEVYYNDSKGTNTDAAIKAIDAMPSKTVLIGGGYDKKSDYAEWVSRFPGKVRKLILIGQTREHIAAACEKIGFTDYIFAESLEEAVAVASREAKAGRLQMDFMWKAAKSLISQTLAGQIGKKSIWKM